MPISLSPHDNTYTRPYVEGQAHRDIRDEMYNYRTPVGIQKEKIHRFSRQAKDQPKQQTQDHRSDPFARLFTPVKRHPIRKLVAVGVLVVLLLAMSRPGRTSGSAVGLSDATTSNAPAVEEHSQAENGIGGSPWWEGRSWASEIDTCGAATDDTAGCQWLAGTLIHRRCELKTYQTFAAALTVGASFAALHQGGDKQRRLSKQLGDSWWWPEPAMSQEYGAVLPDLSPNRTLVT